MCIFVKWVKAILYHRFYFFHCQVIFVYIETFRLSIMSSFFVRFKSSFRYEVIVFPKKWDSAQSWRADIELVMEAMPVPWLATPALVVFSSVKSMGFPRKCLVVLLILNILSWYFRNFRMRFFQYEQMFAILHCPASIIWVI